MVTRASLPDRALWRGRSVFLTGHTGFKGSWLACWLEQLGAHVTGYALSPPAGPSLYALAGVRTGLAADHRADICDGETLQQAIEAARPDLIIHMAAQSLVRRGYREPLDTWRTNVMGTAHVLDAARTQSQLRGTLVVTTDKCYENREWTWGYREIDRLGGRDPYSASKAGAELVAESYRRSFPGGALIATARAGNVIGGGDFSEDRLVPDAARAVAAGARLSVRHPQAVRPWQHVLDCLNGYLILSERLLRGDAIAAQAFNFGPPASDNLSVGGLLENMRDAWPVLRWDTPSTSADGMHEASMLHLDTAKAQALLEWRPCWTVREATRETARWYEAWIAGGDLRALTLAQIARFEAGPTASGEGDD